MKKTAQNLLLAISALTFMQLSWWGSWINPTDYQFGVDTHRMASQQIHSENKQNEDQHFLEKEAVEPPIQEEEGN